MSDAPTVETNSPHPGSLAERCEEAHVAQRATPPPLPKRRTHLPPPVPDEPDRSRHAEAPGPGGVPRRLLRDVVTLPPFRTNAAVHFFWPAVTPARPHPVLPPAPSSHAHWWVLAAVVQSVSGAFAAGMWAGREVERETQKQIAQSRVRGKGRAAVAQQHVPAVTPPLPVAPVPASVLADSQQGVAGTAAPGTAVASERPWEVAGAGGLALLESPGETRPSPLLSPENTPAAVVRLADAPLESPLVAASEDDEEVSALMDALPGPSPSPRRLERDRAPSVWVPPAPTAQELPEALSRDDVLAVLLAHKDELVECVREQQARTPELHGTLMVRWNIRPAGATSGITVESSELEDTALARCARRRIGGWTFPAHRQQMGPVRVPFTF